MNPLFAQTLGYGAVILLILFVISFLQRGFFWKYLRVKSSMGRLVLVKIRDINIDSYATGKIDGETLLFKHNKDNKTIAIKDRGVFYRSIGILWVDYDNSTSALIKCDFSAIEGFDSVKFTNLILRALYKPAITNNLEKVTIALLFILAILTAISLYFGYSNGVKLDTLTLLVSNMKGSVVSAVI